MFKTYFKSAWRNMLKYKVSTIINTLSLTLGITACLVIFLDARFELSYDNFHPDKDRIYRVVTSTQDNAGEIEYKPTIPDPLARIIRADFTGLEDVADRKSVV